MAIFQRWFSRPKHAPDAQNVNPADSPDISLRRRSFANLALSEAKEPIAEPEEIQPKHAQTVATQSVTESISVVLRRQVPIRFEEESRSWLGGLPKMPIGTLWPHANPETPLHFVAQLNCADLPPELWEGLGPRSGWLLLFLDVEAFTDQEERPFARVLHLTELGPEAEPPEGLYFARSNVFDVSRLQNTLRNAQRRHFRKWPVDLLPAPADTSELTGSILYDAPENDRSLAASGCFPEERPMTWRGAYAILANLVHRYDAQEFKQNWLGNSGGMLDYPETDVTVRNRDWQARREQIAAQLPAGYHCPEFTQADAKLQAELYEERRTGWTQRAFKVLDETVERDTSRLSAYRAKVSDALANANDQQAKQDQGSVEFYEELLKKYQNNRTYLEQLFAQYPSEDAFVAEINSVGCAHLEWAQRCQVQLRELLNLAGTMDLDASITPEEWENITAQIASMKSVYWQKTYETDVLRKVETGIDYAAFPNVIREEVLDFYTASATTVNGIDPAIIANLEPRLRHLETARPHKLGGYIDSYYEEPLKDDHLLLFQVPSDAAIGWICGDLGLIYVSIHKSDLQAGRFDKVEAWLEA